MKDESWKATAITLERQMAECRARIVALSTERLDEEPRRGIAPLIARCPFCSSPVPPLKPRGAGEEK